MNRFPAGSISSRTLLFSALLGLAGLLCGSVVHAESVARQWNEELLAAIRRDLARPTVHARNLFHSSSASWDAWVAFDDTGKPWLHAEKLSSEDPEAARREAISYAQYRLLSWRFRNSPGATQTLRALNDRMVSLGFDPDFLETGGTSPAALGNRIAASYIAFGLQDGANEANDYENRFYRSVNGALFPALAGNPDLNDPNRYQPLSLELFFDQAGNPLPSGFPEFLGPEWGQVTTFALDPSDLEITPRSGFDYWTFLDPGPPPLLGGPGDQAYKDGFAQVVEWSGLLDPGQGETIDISPGARGNNLLGNNAGRGHVLNPGTGLPYAPNPVPAGDYYRVLAEFWADGPDSETPPGHWFTIANTVNDSPALERRLGGQGEILDELEWDVKLYFALGGAMHDAAVTAWGVKGRYDYIRPVSAIRHMAGLGQSSDPAGRSYHPDGIPLRPGSIEVITPQSVRAGERHAHLLDDQWENLGKIAVYAWRGPDHIGDPETESAGVGWILAENWWPYQRPSFVTPPFAGYVSGHSTYSRAAAELLAAFTGSRFFPGGLGEFRAPAGEFLVFEDGPSEDVVLQWATYFDAADESGLSRIYGGIHPPADDIPGRLMGAVVGVDAWARAQGHFQGTVLNDMEPRPLLPTRAEEGLPVFSGSWFPRGSGGEGLSIMALTGDSAILSEFGFDPEGRPTWRSGLAQRSGNVLAGLLGSSETQDTAEYSSQLAVTFHNCHEARFEHRSTTTGSSNRQTGSRLTQLGGLQCRRDQRTDQQLTARWGGVWDQADGTARVLLEVLPDGRILLYGLAHNAAGDARWWLAIGQYENGSVTGDVWLARRSFTEDGTATIELESPGSFEMSSASCGSAELMLPEGTPGDMAGSARLVRFASAGGLDCS